MIPDLGYAALLLALATAVYSTIAAWHGSRTNQPRFVESARNASVAVFPLIILSCGLLVASLLRGDFSVEYVWRVSSREMPTYLKVTALWGGQAGSLLFWNLLLSAFTSIAMARKWREQRELMPYALIIVSLTQIFFLAISAFVENPFARLAVIPPDGNGLNPLLRHPGMIIHPPMLYLGFTGFVIPYTFAMAALISGKLDDGWIQTTRRWTLVAWLFLSMGLILGGRWAYDVLGWGGYWGWDPVENASLIPWLVGTAFFHSVMIQEKRNMFKMWNIALIILTYCLVIWGTFTVRSGVISSVHSFAQSAIGPLFFGFICFMFVISLYWAIKRRDELKSENQIHSFLSREAAFLFNNFLFLIIAAIVFLFTIYPIISELLTGEKGFVGPPVYKQALWPLFAVLVLWMGVAPLTMWIRTSLQRLGLALRWPAIITTLFVIVLAVLGIHNPVALIGFWVVALAGILTILEFWKGTQARMRSKGESLWLALSSLVGRNRRRYGGYLVHLGVVVIGLGIIGVEIFQQETQIRLESGQSLTLGAYEMVFQNAQQYPGADDLIYTEATVDVYKNGRFLQTLHPRNELYTRTQQPMTIPDARSTMLEDFYVIMINWEATSATTATFRVYLNPLINWIWGGGIIFVLGTIVAAWPKTADEKARVAQSSQYIPAITGD
ncbi:MAG: heme lyase CcmF/NrfE family subunit [Ardenticatenaceae bacterium]|nr:heme lyase CcmF/NrfE family subunit [Ardenticatenaceae bacterium]